MALTYTETDTATYTDWSHPGQTGTINIGTASADRIVVVAMAVFGTLANITPTSVTINGTNATLALSVSGTDPSGNSIFHRVYTLPVASGTTASWAYNCPFATGIFVTVGTLKGDVNAIVFSTGSTSSYAQTNDPHFLTATVPIGGVAVFWGSIWNGAGPLTWTGATQDKYFFDSGTTSFSSFLASHGTSSTISFTGANNQFNQLGMVSFGPFGSVAADDRAFQGGAVIATALF